MNKRIKSYGDTQNTKLRYFTEIVIEMVLKNMVYVDSQITCLQFSFCIFVILLQKYVMYTVVNFFDVINWCYQSSTTRTSIEQYCRSMLHTIMYYLLDRIVLLYFCYVAICFLKWHWLSIVLYFVIQWFDYRSFVVLISVEIDVLHLKWLFLPFHR